MIYYPCSPIEIRDATVERLKAITELHEVRLGAAQAVKPDECPIASVFYSSDRATPMGDANCGIPKFDHIITLHIHLVVTALSNDDADVLTGDLIETIKATLFSDGTWVELFEAMEGFDVSYDYSLDSGHYQILADISMELMFRSEWPPRLVHDFTGLNISRPSNGAEYSQPLNLGFDLPQ